MNAVTRAGWRRITILPAAGVGVLGVASGIYAAIPDSSGAIHGCYAQSGGQLPVIDSETGAACSKTEVALNWGTQPVWRANPAFSVLS
jgi:hypothetical protein